METSGANSEQPLTQLTARESELLRKAGERVYALSRRVTERERESERLRGEVQSLRELLAESREVRRVLSSQVESLQTELNREYEERSELRRLLASLHLQMQELLPVITGLNHARELPAAASASQARNDPSTRGWSGRLRGFARELRGTKPRRDR